MTDSTSTCPLGPPRSVALYGDVQKMPPEVFAGDRDYMDKKKYVADSISIGQLWFV